MRLLPSYCILIISFFMAFPSLATPKKEQLRSEYFGINYNFSQHILTVYFDQNKILKNLPRLQKSGLVDKNLSLTEAGFYEIQLPAMMSIPYITKIIKRHYSSNTENDPIHVKSYLITRDLYGNETNIFCYSFNFNRELYQKINWNNFHENNLLKIAPNFKTSKTCKVLYETNPLSI